MPQALSTSAVAMRAAARVAEEPDIRLASVTTAFPCRFACAVAWPRSEPAMRVAVLSHTLMNGFFFSQRLDMFSFG